MQFIEKIRKHNTLNNYPIEVLWRFVSVWHFLLVVVVVVFFCWGFLGFFCLYVVLGFFLSLFRSRHSCQGWQGVPLVLHWADGWLNDLLRSFQPVFLEYCIDISEHSAEGSTAGSSPCCKMTTETTQNCNRQLLFLNVFSSHC